MSAEQIPLRRRSVILAHTSIRVSNMEKSIAFYTKIFGLKVLGRLEIPQIPHYGKKNNVELAWLQDSEGKGGKLELSYFREQKKLVQAEYEDRLFDHLAFDTKNMDETISLMRREKVTITDEPFRLSSSGSFIAFVEDPDGTLIELIERK